MVNTGRTAHAAGLFRVWGASICLPPYISGGGKYRFDFSPSTKVAEEAEEDNDAVKRSDDDNGSTLPRGPSLINARAENGGYKGITFIKSVETNNKNLFVGGMKPLLNIYSGRTGSDYLARGVSHGKERRRGSF